MKKNDLSNVVTGALFVGAALTFVLFCSQLFATVCDPVYCKGKTVGGSIACFETQYKKSAGDCRSPSSSDPKVFVNCDKNTGGLTINATCTDCCCGFDSWTVIDGEACYCNHNNPSFSNFTCKP